MDTAEVKERAAADLRKQVEDMKEKLTQEEAARRTEAATFEKETDEVKTEYKKREKALLDQIDDLEAELTTFSEVREAADDLRREVMSMEDDLRE
eukprot:950410-Ditylum_brightwellii.AAC.1